ncbi:hypothetical protein [Varibaculum cambriense]|uniref:hypothetical protein n=1 Tax=Varibaculum cambriense TaxID=184870 RepID=UPI0029082EA8|nr:hypothetical protein [Varibaculum cambriense]MDU5541665.1 hypothetical protein [Varibaculum cambriense]
MKRANHAKRFPQLIASCLLAGLITATSLLVPTTPAQAADRYFLDISITEDLTQYTSQWIGEKPTFSKKYKTQNSNTICQKYTSETNIAFKKYAKNNIEQFGLVDRKVRKCQLVGSHFFIDSSAKSSEDLLKKATSPHALKLTDKHELVHRQMVTPTKLDLVFREVGKRDDIGYMRVTLPGKIKSVTPNIGKISGNTWTLEEPPIADEIPMLEKSGEIVTITAERYDSKLGLILKITIPAAVVIAAACVVLLGRRNRKGKQLNPSR